MRGKQKVFEINLEEKQFNFGRQGTQRFQEQSNFENPNSIQGKEDYNRGQSRTFFNDNQEEEFENEEVQDMNYRQSFNQQSNYQNDDDDDDGPPGLEDVGEMSPNSKFQQNNSQNGINNSSGGPKSSMNSISDTLKSMQLKNADASKQKDSIQSVSKNIHQISAKIQSVNAMNLNSGRGKPKQSEEVDRKEGLDINSSSKLGNMKNQTSKENENIKPEKVDFIPTTQPQQNKAQEEDGNNQNNENEIQENQKSYDEVNQYMQKINETIRVSNKKIDSIPQLQQIQREIEQQIQEYYQDLDCQRKAYSDIEKNTKKTQQEKEYSEKYQKILKYLMAMINSKKETLKYIKDNVQLILDSNWQSKICQKMGNTLIQFHSIIMDDLNKLKYYNKTLPSKQEMEYKDKMEALQTQLEQEQDQRKKLEEELNKRIIDFQNLFCDAQEAKKIIREQLIEIKEQKERLKQQTDDLERKQKEFKKITAQAPPPKEKEKDNFDAESRRSDRTSNMNHNYQQMMYKHKIQALKNQNMKDDEMHMSQSSSDHKESRKKFNNNNNMMMMNHDNNRFYSEEEEENDNGSYLESYDHMYHKEPEYKYEQQQIFKNLAPNLKQENQQFQLGQQQQQQQQQPQQSEGKILKLASPPLSTIQASPVSSPLNNAANINNQLSPSIKMVINKGVGKSALKKKLSDHLNEDEVKQNQQFSIGLFDFNVVVDESSQNGNNFNNSRSYSNNNRQFSSGKKIFNSTINSSFQKSVGPANSFGNSTINNNQEPIQSSNSNTLRQMIQSIQNQQKSLREEMSSFSIINN